MKRNEMVDENFPTFLSTLFIYKIEIIINLYKQMLN